MLDAYGLGQAALIGLLSSTIYKILSGRVPPPIFLSGDLLDTSREFRFGVLRGGAIWGWPSSHTTVAFSMAIAFSILYPQNRLLKYVAFLYALYIGFGVSVSIHWLSDFVAGAIIGTVIGVVVGRSFSEIAQKGK